MSRASPVRAGGRAAAAEAALMVGASPIVM